MKTYENRGNLAQGFFLSNYFYIYIKKTHLQ